LPQQPLPTQRAPLTRRAELRALGDVLLEFPRVIIGTDDMYEKIYWSSEPFCSLLTVVPELYNRTITINGVSKAYAMTGWRIGYCGGPKEIITAMATIQASQLRMPRASRSGLPSPHSTATRNASPG